MDNLRYILATLHLLTLGIGVASIWGRSRALRRLKDASGLNDVFMADNVWGIAAILWIGTGVWRAFGGVEKGTEYYINNTAFQAKMGFFFLLILLELWPMITLVRWRIRKAKGLDIDLRPAPLMTKLSYAELCLLIPVVAMAAAMARGIFY